MIRLSTYPTYRALKNQVNFKAKLEISMEAAEYIRKKAPDYSFSEMREVQDLFKQKTPKYEGTAYLTLNSANVSYNFTECGNNPFCKDCVKKPNSSQKVLEIRLNDGPKEQAFSLNALLEKTSQERKEQYGLTDTPKSPASLMASILCFTIGRLPNWRQSLKEEYKNL